MHRRVTKKHRGPVSVVGEGHTTGATYVGQRGEATRANPNGVFLIVKFESGEKDFFLLENLRAPPPLPPTPTHQQPEQLPTQHLTQQPGAAAPGWGDAAEAAETGGGGWGEKTDDGSNIDAILDIIHAGIGEPHLLRSAALSKMGGPSAAEQAWMDAQMSQSPPPKGKGRGGKAAA